MPEDQVRAGQRGVAYTVFQGVEPEPMAVEILGILHNGIGPGQDMILARLHGPKPEYTGVVAGMSGSPVYLDGKLVGALSFRIGQFSKEPIAGITPIAQMMEVRAAADTPGQDPTGSTAEPPGLGSSGLGQARPMDTPVALSGFSPEVLARFAPQLRTAGLTPVEGVGGAGEQPQPEPIIPGSAVSAVLVRGDISAAVTCTVTYVDPRQLLACGHPFQGYGVVDMPMTKTRVVATLPSPADSFKIVNTTATVGAFTQDRASAILGVFGRTARMVPVHIAVAPVAGLPARQYGFEVIDHKTLTTSLMLLGVYQSLHGTNRSAEETSYRLRGELQVQGHNPVHLDSLITPGDSLPAGINAALYVNAAFSRVYGNAVDRPVLTGLNLQVETLPERRSAVLESATLSHTEAHAGDQVEVRAVLRPYRGLSRAVVIPLTLPEGLEPGPVRIVVGEGAVLDRLTEPPASEQSLDLTDTIASLNRRHGNDQVWCAVLAAAPQATLRGGGALPDMPVSVASILEPLKAGQGVQLNGESVLATASAPADYAVSGSQVLSMTIR